MNIDYHKTSKAFKALGLSNFDAVYTQAKQSDLFDSYEQGTCSTQFFINGLLDYLPAGTNVNAIISAWNAMLLDLPYERIDMLLNLKQKYRTFLLSNTNDLHVTAFHKIIKEQNNLESLNPLFEKVYFSCDLKMRKPNPEIFLKVCTENNLKPSETLFIDDSLQHVQGATNAGLLSYHLTNGETLLELPFLK